MSARQRARDRAGQAALGKRTDPSQNPFPAPGSVRSVAGAQVTVALDGWGDEHFYGPVPWAAATCRIPVAGDSCALHFTADQEPFYAVVFGTGSPVIPDVD